MTPSSPNLTVADLTKLVEDLTEALEQSNAVLQVSFLRLCKFDGNPATTEMRRTLSARFRANRDVLARVKEATRTGAVVAS